MSKIISNIEQLDEGGINPKSGIHEDKLWRFHFDDNTDTRVLGRNKVLEYLTKGTVPPKTVHSFKRWIITTTHNSIRTWVIVYDDKSHVQLINKDFYSLMTNGHRKKDEEKEEAEGQRGAVSTAIAQAQQQAQGESQPSVTTSEDRIKVDAFRTQVKEEGSEEAYRELIKKDALPHPDKKGFEDLK